MVERMNLIVFQEVLDVRGGEEEGGQRRWKKQASTEIWGEGRRGGKGRGMVLVGYRKGVSG